MQYNSKIHPLPMLVKSVIGKAEKIITGLNYLPGELVVVNYHSTPKKFIADFEKQVLFFKKKFNVISPAELNDFYGNKKSESKKCNLLFTFDDGLKNNLYAAGVLEKYNIKALFFVVPDFIDTPKVEQKNYYIKNIRPIINLNIDHEPEDFEAMNWTELKTLAAKGNQLGAHTQTHTLVAKNSDLQNSVLEISGCKKNIEKASDTDIISFCSINDTTVSVGKKEKELIGDNYKFHFTTLPGSNSENKDPLFIKRRNIEVHWLMGAVYFAIGNSDLQRWKAKIQEYSKL